MHSFTLEPERPQHTEYFGLACSFGHARKNLECSVDSEINTLTRGCSEISEASIITSRAEGRFKCLPVLKCCLVSLSPKMLDLSVLPSAFGTGSLTPVSSGVGLSHVKGWWGASCKGPTYVFPRRQISALWSWHDFCEPYQSICKHLWPQVCVWENRRPSPAVKAAAEQEFMLHVHVYYWVC